MRVFLEKSNKSSWGFSLEGLTQQLFGFHRGEYQVNKRIELWGSVQAIEACGGVCEVIQTLIICFFFVHAAYEERRYYHELAMTFDSDLNVKDISAQNGHP